MARVFRDNYKADEEKKKAYLNEKNRSETESDSVVPVPQDYQAAFLTQPKPKNRWWILQTGKAYPAEKSNTYYTSKTATQTKLEPK